MSSVSASATTPGNVGPGISSQIGPMSNFASLHAIGKLRMKKAKNLFIRITINTYVAIYPWIDG